MKGIFSRRRNKNPHTNEESEKQERSFFGKKSKKPFFNSNTKGAIQTKLTVGEPGDKYEKEADNVANAVVNNTSKPDIQNKEISSIQRESLATPQEDEKLGTAEQRMEADKLIQEKPEIQKMGQTEEEEGLVNKMEGEEEEGMLNKMEGEKEEEEMKPLQKKTDSGSANTASQGITNQLKNKSGKGKNMSKKTKSEMETSFGVDFGGVNIHTDQDAIKMNKELGAQAFTHGKDVYFNTGKYNPETTTGKRLLAHELTHVVQQNKKSEMLQRYPGPAPMPKRMERKVKDALADMQQSKHAYVVGLEAAISGGKMDVAVPDYFDTSNFSGNADDCPQNLLDPMSFSSGTIRKIQWEKGMAGYEKRDFTARVPGTNILLPIEKGIRGYTRQFTGFDGVIYLYVESNKELLNTIIHEALHLKNPLTTGTLKEKFVSELRSYYYGEYRNRKPEQSRFETALGDAEKATSYLASIGSTVAMAVGQKNTWMSEIGTP